MSNNGPPIRRTWNKDEYNARAKELAALESTAFASGNIGLLITSNKRLPPPPSERTLLDVTDRNLNLDVGLNTRRMIAIGKDKRNQGGYWCEICGILSKDSSAHLDHINGRQHLEMLGMTTKVERVDVSRVKAKLDELKSDSKKVESSTDVDIEDRLMLAQQEEEERRRRRKEKKKKKGKNNEDDEEIPLQSSLLEMLAQAQSEGLNLFEDAKDDNPITGDDTIDNSLFTTSQLKLFEKNDVDRNVLKPFDISNADPSLNSKSSLGLFSKRRKIDDHLLKVEEFDEDEGQILTIDEALNSRIHQKAFLAQEDDEEDLDMAAIMGFTSFK